MNRKGTFQKGNKLGGRKPIPEDIKNMFEDKGLQAVKKLFWFMENAEDEKIQFDATKEIINRWLGKPKESHEITGKGGEPLVIKVIKTYGNRTGIDTKAN